MWFLLPLTRGEGAPSVPQSGGEAWGERGRGEAGPRPWAGRPRRNGLRRAAGGRQWRRRRRRRGLSGARIGCGGRRRQAPAARAAAGLARRSRLECAPQRGGVLGRSAFRRRLRAVPLEPGRASALLAASTAAAAAPLAVCTHTMTKKEKKSFNQSLAEWKLFIYNPTTGEFLGRTAKSWGERAAVGRRGRPRSGGRRAGSGGKGKAGDGSPRGGPKSSRSLRRPQRFSSGAARLSYGRRRRRGGAAPFISSVAGGPPLAPEAAGPSGSPRRAAPVPSSRPGAERTCCSGLPPRAAPEAGDPCPESSPERAGAERPGLPLYRARCPGEALAEAAGGAQRFGEARPCPTPGERKFPLSPLSCDSSTLPPRSEECEC